MEAIRTKGVAHEGLLTIPVLKEFEEKELEVIVLASAENRTEAEGDEEMREREEKVKRLMSIVGAAKFPEFPINKYDVYEQ